MNLKELSKNLSKKHGFSQALSQRILKTILKNITSELKKGNIVRLRNFGTFQAKKSHGKLKAKFNPSKNFFK